MNIGQPTATQSALGRYWGSADTCSIVSFTGTHPCARLDLRWNDGAYLYSIFDTFADAEACANRLGFARA